MNIYVGNLAYAVSDEDLKEAFGAYGNVVKANVIQDRETGRSKGFGFVEMENNEEGQKSIQGLDGTGLQGRDIKVNEARPRTERA